METSNKLLEFQKRVSAIHKDSVNPFFKSKYFDVNTVIDTIKPILNDVGLVVTQPLETEDGRNILFTNILDGEKTLAVSRVYLPEQSDAQKFGAAVTYFRRYALVSLLLLQGEEDDDGNKLASRGSKPLKSQNFTSGVPLGKGNATTGISDEWEGAPKAVRPLSLKQGQFIKSLRSQKGLEPLADEEIRKMTSQEASKEIERLTALEELPTIERNE